MAGHDRRSFLRELLRGAQRAAGELGTLRDAAETHVDEPWSSGLQADLPDTTRPPSPAPPTTQLATADDLRELCREVGHEEWAEDAAGVARVGIRLTPGDGRSRLGGLPDVPETFAWPVWEDAELRLIAQVALDELPESELPRSGSLLVFYALDRAPSGLALDDGGACRIVHVGDQPTTRAQRAEHLPELPVTASPELMLPDVPPFDAEAWDLDAWSELRERLAGLQGVELEERVERYHALHRLLGYPDTFAGGMELDAELLESGIDFEAEPYAHLQYDDLAPAAAEWRLLLQLSNDDELGVALGYLDRVFVWIRDEDLRAGRFDRVRAFVR